jgi:hypothetical protein
MVDDEDIESVWQRALAAQREAMTLGGRVFRTQGRSDVVRRSMASDRTTVLALLAATAPPDTIAEVADLLIDATRVLRTRGKAVNVLHKLDPKSAREVLPDLIRERLAMADEEDLSGYLRVADDLHLSDLRDEIITSAQQSSNPLVLEWLGHVER